MRKQAEKPTQRAKFKKKKKEKRESKVGEENTRERNGGSQPPVGVRASGKQFSEGLN